MFKFFWGKGSQHSADRLKIQKDLFYFQKTLQHGFPSKPTALAWDPILRLLCIGTRTGALKIYGAPGVEFCGQVEKERIISNLFFIPGQGKIVVLCEDNSLHLWEIDANCSTNLKCIHSQSLEGKLKKISVCSVSSNGEILFIGTENGNIYLLDLSRFEMTDTVVYLDIVMQNVTEDFKVNPGAVELVYEQPSNPDCILICYTRGLIILWNLKTLSAEQTFVASQQVESACWYPDGQKFATAHNDGSYMIWKIVLDSENVNVSKKPETSSPYGPFPCKAITKILCSGSEAHGGDVIAFSGGMPRANYGDRFTLSVLKGEKTHVTFDLSSRAIDFCLINDINTNETEALVILADEELVIVDLITPGWPCFAAPYLASLHCSAITAQSTVLLTPQLYAKFMKHSQRLSPSAKISSRPWPVNGGISNSESVDPSSNRLILLTGHEDGSVRFWDASTASFHQIAKFSTSFLFAGDDLDLPHTDEVEPEEDEWPPFRKIGVFDPYSDDPRLAVKKLALCPSSGILAVAGTAGQVVLAEFSEIAVEKDIPISSVNIVSDRDNFVWKGHDKLTARTEVLSFTPGFQPHSVLQMHPPAAATALSLHADWSLLAVGTAHGLALYDMVLKKEILAKCTLNPNDISGVGDQPMSRRKSFKKSLRESFRRLRKGRSQRPPTTPKSAQSVPAGKHETTHFSPSLATEVRPVERQVEARPPDDGMGSMVRCVVMAKTYIISQSSNASATLWAGTNSGAIFVFNLTIPSSLKRKSEAVGVQLAKEIQLKHRAPVVAINIIDAACLSMNDLVDAGNIRTTESAAPHRVVISSEEQFKVFTLPNLRPYGKYKLTAYTGCKVRRVAVTPFTAKSSASYMENCLVCLCNQGDFHILSLPELRRQMDAQSIKRDDIHATSTAVFTPQGEAFYMISSSELQRVSLSARCCPRIQCQIPGLAKNENDKIEGNESSLLEKIAITAEGVTENAKIPVSTSEEQELNKSRSHNESNNSTIVSVEPETSFGDITMDSIRDHLNVAMTPEECRTTKISSTERVSELTELAKLSMVDVNNDDSRVSKQAEATEAAPPSDVVETASSSASPEKIEQAATPKKTLPNESSTPQEEDCASSPKEAQDAMKVKEMD